METELKAYGYLMSIQRYVVYKSDLHMFWDITASNSEFGKFKSYIAFNQTPVPNSSPYISLLPLFYEPRLNGPPLPLGYLSSLKNSLNSRKSSSL